MKLSSVLLCLLLVSFSCNSPAKKNTTEIVTDIESSIKNENKTEESIKEPEDSSDYDFEKIDNTDQIREAKAILKKYPELDEYAVFEKQGNILIKGDFFGDKIEDVAFLIKDSAKVKLCVIDFSSEKRFFFIGNAPDNLENMDDYSWVGYFETVKPGETLWSNYTDDFRELKQVPKNELVRLKYYAIYVHAYESCGGGYIFWKDNKFNWLQQE